MELPPDFQFSQSSLQDFVDCARRFHLRYLRRLAWPAVEAEPALEHERHMRNGERFHQLAQQHLLGVPAEALTAVAHDAPLDRWWRNYQAHAPALWGGEARPAQGRHHAEVSLSAELSGFRIVAKYDLVLVQAGERALIVDWKTSGRRPSRQVLAARLQTRVYPYLLVVAGGGLNGGRPFSPEQVEMAYWFTDHPAEPERFAYGADQFQRDGEYLAGLVAEIQRLDSEQDLRTSHIERCRFCVYRSLCERGVQAGPLDEAEAPDEASAFDFQLDFDQIGEIGF